MAAEPFPTLFAVMMGTACDLFIPDMDRNNSNIEEYMEKRERMIIFQKIAVAAPFEQCLQAYYGFELSQHQTEQLRLIHSTTRSWLLGHVAGNLIGSLDDKFASGRDKREISQSLIENFIKPQNEGGSASETKGLIIEFKNSTGTKQEVARLITPVRSVEGEIVND